MEGIANNCSIQTSQLSRWSTRVLQTPFHQEQNVSSAVYKIMAEALVMSSKSRSL
jgi:hypothetical protein